MNALTMIQSETIALEIERMLKKDIPRLKYHYMKSTFQAVYVLDMLDDGKFQLELALTPDDYDKEGVKAKVDYFREWINGLYFQKSEERYKERYKHVK